MKRMIAKLADSYKSVCRKAYSTATTLVHRHSTTLMLVLGVALLVGGIALSAQAATASPTFNESKIAGAGLALLCLLEGSFGALVMIVAGLVAIVAAAMGAYRAAMAALVVAVGAFILRSFVTLFFGDVLTTKGTYNCV